MLLPKSDPDPRKVASERHFRSKRIAQQDEVHKLYPEYREVKTVELMTAVLLNDLVNGEPRMLDGSNTQRCLEPNASGGRVCVGYFDAFALKVADGFGVSTDPPEPKAEVEQKLDSTFAPVAHPPPPRLRGTRRGTGWKP